MPSSSPGSPGLFANAAAGYRLAWVHRRQLLAVLLPLLAPALIGLFLLDLLLGRDQMVIINHVPLFRDDGGPARARAQLVLVAAFWLLGLSAAAPAAAGAARGRAIRPVRAIWSAVRHFPLFVFGTCAAIGATLLMLWMAAGLAGKLGSGPVGLVLILGVLAFAGLEASRMLIGVLTHQLGGSVWELTRGRVAPTAGAFLLGGVGVPLLLAYLGDGLRTALAVTLPGAAQMIGAVAATALVAVQAGILAHVYLLPRAAVPLSELESVDVLVAELSGGRPRRPWLSAGATVVAVLAPVGVAVANPFGAPTVQAHRKGPATAVVAAWPTGRHPVIATTPGAWFCDNDACDRHVDQNGGPPVMDGHGTTGISADGHTVIKATLTGGKGNGGPFVHYALCTRDGCPAAYVPVRASAEEAFGWPELAAAVAPDRAAWFALAMPSPDDQPGPATYQISFLRCTDLRCDTPQRHRAGTVERLVERPSDDLSMDRQRIRLSIGADGRPFAIVRTGEETVSVTCDPVTCAAPRSTRAFAGEPGRAWAAPDAPTGKVSSLQPGMLRIGGRPMVLRSDEVAHGSGALAVSGSRVYATEAEATTRRPALRITVGAPTEQERPERQQSRNWQQVLWRCDTKAIPKDWARCERQTLDTFETLFGREVLAASADGRVLIVRPDRVLLVPAPEPSRAEMS